MAEEGADQWTAEENSEQPREESSSPHKSPSPPEHEEKTTHVRFLLSNAEAGSVIGKGGSTISDFQAQSGARIQLSRNFEYFPGTSDRIVMISGTIDDVLRAVELIMTKLLDEFHSEEEGDVDPRLRFRLIVPNGSCGGLIGKGGSIIKSFIEDSQAGIKISPLENSYPGLYDRLVTVDGNLGEQMRAIELMLLRLADDPQYTHSVVGPFPYAGRVPPYIGMHYGPGGGRGKAMNGRIQTKEEGSNSVTIGVPDEQIGLVVGRGGRNLVEISQISGAKIRISDRGDFMTGTSNRKVTITGSQRSIRVAESMISGKASSIAAKG